jgi:hypothetical protein
MVEEDFTKENDYTLVTELKESHSEGSGSWGESKACLVSSIRRTFNFLSAQVTTVTRDWAYQRTLEGTGGSSSAVSTTTQIQNFDDVQSNAEIKFMHAKLIGMGGKPPSLEEIFPNEMHKKAGGVPTLGKGQG